MRIGKALLCLEILAGLVLAMPTMGADLTDAQVREGLTKLDGLLGTEVPKDARWVRAESQGQRFGIFTREEDVFRTEGNALLFDEKAGIEARILVLHSGAIYNAKAEKEDVQGEAQRGEYRATWKNADLAKDVAAATEWLAKEAKRPGANQAQVPVDPFSAEGVRVAEAGQFAAHRQTALFWATLLLRTGHEAESLGLARVALANTDEKQRKQLLDSFFDRRANQAYQEAMQDFARHHDWSKLGGALTAVVSQYPLGWQQRDAVRVFIHKVTERAKLPAMPAIKASRPLSETEQKVLIEWFQELEAGKVFEESRWTLPSPPSEEDADDREAKGRLTAFPRNYGLAAVPLLASILGDETLTLVGLNDSSFYNYGTQGGYFPGSGDQDAATKLRQAYGRLQTPPTRASLAWNLLQRVLPNDLQSEGSNSENVAEVAPDVLAWYASLKDATPGDIALAYLEAGEQDADIIAQALTVTDPKKLARLENSMLEAAQVYDMSNLVAYVEKLGPEKGPAFVTKVRQKLEAEITSFRSNDQERQRKQMENGLKRLDTAAKGGAKKPDLKEMLKMLSVYDPTAEDADQEAARESFGEFPKLMAKLPLPERLDLILAVLPDFRSPVLAANVLSLALNGQNNAGREEIKPAERQALLERTRPQWQKLLDAPQDESVENSESLVVLIVAALEELVTGKVEMDALRQLTTLGDRGTKVLRERATALLAGEQVAPLPRAAAIKSDERKQLLADWSKKSVAEIGSGLETLPVDKLLALSETLSRSAEVPDNFKAYMAVIHEVKVKGLPDAAAWQAYRDKAWSKDTVVALAKQASAHTGGPITIHLQRSVPILGFQLHVTEVRKLGNNWEAQTVEQAARNLGENLPKLGKRISTGYFQQERANANWAWLDSPTMEAPKEAAKTTQEGDSSEELNSMRAVELKAWETLSNAVSAPKTSPVRLFFISAPTADLVQKD